MAKEKFVRTALKNMARALRPIPICEGDPRQPMRPELHTHKPVIMRHADPAVKVNKAGETKPQYLCPLCGRRTINPSAWLDESQLACFVSEEEAAAYYERKQRYEKMKLQEVING